MLTVPSNPEDYTGAVINEHVAAQVFEHDRPEKLSAANNDDYTLGEIGGHNVQVLVLVTLMENTVYPSQQLLQEICYTAFLISELA